MLTPCDGKLELAPLVTVSVDEEGTEAAAASIVIVVVGSQPEPPSITIDRPFIFLIRDQKTGTVLFMGRVLDPSV